MMVTNKWIDRLVDCDCILKYYNFTMFAMSLNEFDEDSTARLTLPPTDCRFRPDVREMEHGDIGKRLNSLS